MFIPLVLVNKSIDEKGRRAQEQVGIISNACRRMRPCLTCCVDLFGSPAGHTLMFRAASAHALCSRHRWMQMSRWLDRFTPSITCTNLRRSSSIATRLRFTIPAFAVAAAAITTPSTTTTTTTTTRPANARALILLAAGLGCSVVGWWAKRHTSFGKGPQEREDEQQEGDGGRSAAGTTCPAWYRPPVTIERFATGAAQASRDRCG